MTKFKYNCIIASLTAFMVSILLIFFLLYYFRGTDAVFYGPKLVIDHDGGADDAMAIFMALQFEKYFNGYPVVGLTTTHGNVNESQVFINTQKFLGIADRREIPIYRGCAYPLIENIPSDYYFGFDGIGDSKTEYLEYEPIEAKPQHAALALIEMSKKYEGELIVLAIGALTNIAMAMQLDPDFLKRLSQLYVAAGHVQSEDYSEAEFNAAMDVEAYYMVLKNSHPERVTVIPFSQITISHNISRDWRMFTLGCIPTELMRALNVFEQKSIVQSESWCILDPVAMAIVLNESQLVEEMTNVYNSINMCDKRGTIINNFTTIEANAKLVYKVTEQPYKDLLLRLFSADLD